MSGETSDRPVRVCFVIGYFFPLESGAERQAFEQAAELVRQGHEVHVVTRWVEGLRTDDRVSGIQIHRCVRLRRWGPLFGVSFLRGFAGALASLRGQFDLVHTHQALWEAAASGLFHGRFPDVPTIVQPASSGYFGEAQELERTRGRRWLLRLIQRNSRFAAISADIGAEWRKLGIPSERIYETASGVDLRRFRPGPSALEAALPPGPRVLFTGRLHVQKQLDLLIRAWPRVQRESAAQLLLVGDGPERAGLEALAQELGVSRSVHFLGAVASPAEFLRGASLFVLPSRAEGMSNSLLEAMATQLPCLASDIAGNQDLIAHEVTGLLVAPRPEAWSDAILRVLHDPGLADRLGQAAFARVRERYAIDQVVGHNLRLYRELLAAQTNSRPGARAQ